MEPEVQAQLDMVARFREVLNIENDGFDLGLLLEQVSFVTSPQGRVSYDRAEEEVYARTREKMRTFIAAAVNELELPTQ